MVLLQCPSCWRSPSRNQTPGAICFTEFGCASPRVSTKPSESISRKLLINQKRVCFIRLVRFYQKSRHSFSNGNNQKNHANPVTRSGGINRSQDLPDPRPKGDARRR